MLSYRQDLLPSLGELSTCRSSCRWLSFDTLIIATSKSVSRNSCKAAKRLSCSAPEAPHSSIDIDSFIVRVI
jgi:hypothetical protein